MISERRKEIAEILGKGGTPTFSRRDFLRVSGLAVAGLAVACSPVAATLEEPEGGTPEPKPTISVGGDTLKTPNPTSTVKQEASPTPERPYKELNGLRGPGVPYSEELIMEAKGIPEEGETQTEKTEGMGSKI